MMQCTDCGRSVETMADVLTCQGCAENGNQTCAPMGLGEDAPIEQYVRWASRPHKLEPA